MIFLAFSGCSALPDVADASPPPPDAAPVATSTVVPAEIGGRAMNSFEQQLMRHSLERYTGDLDVMKRKKVLRVLTRNNSSAYFVSHGQEMGFQYELAKAFADELGLRMTVIVPPSRDDLQSALLEGEGDLIAAGTTITATRAEKLRFTPAVRRSPRVAVVKRGNKKKLTTEADLANFTVHVSFRSTTFDAVKAAEQRIGKPIRIEDVPGELEMEEMMERVAAGEYELTIVDQDVFDLANAAGVEVEAPISVDTPVEKGWVVRPSSPELAKLADAFVRKHSKDGLIKILHDRYFKSKRAAKFVRDQEFRADESGKISPWDDTFRKEGTRLGLDWRLLAAIAFTESRFDPKAASDWGAVGLMQVLPSTAKTMGVTNPEDPVENIKAGAGYFKYLVDRFDDPALEMRQRIRFALASYNAGLGHVFDARSLASKTNRNNKVWFGQVEEALRLKRDRKWHEQTKFGFCRADETINFVSRVQASYDVFARHATLE